MASLPEMHPAVARGCWPNWFWCWTDWRKHSFRLGLLGLVSLYKKKVN
jgi:hypothetical protein